MTPAKLPQGRRRPQPRFRYRRDFRDLTRAQALALALRIPRPTGTRESTPDRISRLRIFADREQITHGTAELLDALRAGVVRLGLESMHIQRRAGGGDGGAEAGPSAAPASTLAGRSGGNR